MRRAAALAALALAGCDSSPRYEATAPGVQYASQTYVGLLEDRVERLESRMALLDNSADLSLGTDGFSTVRTEYGAITIEWTAATPVGAGTRLSLIIGNPHSADFQKLSIYGNIIGADGAVIKTNAMPMRVQGEAKSGAWNSLSAVIADVPPTKIARISVTGVVVGGLELARR